MTDQATPTYIFLDFDGVLRRNTSKPQVLDESCLHCLILGLGPVDEPRIVVSSTWRLGMPLAEITARLPEPLSGMVCGITPEVGDARVYQRFAEIHAYCTKKGIATDEWIAIDDSAELYPPGTRLVLTDPARGFDQASIVQLWNLLDIA
ncbi:MAG: hypothetical protein KDG55_04295 [Rhodocyclaceae bacterium]|nr:hypothetical protein [Rhodocyclaceae bacterium]